MTGWGRLEKQLVAAFGKQLGGGTAFVPEAGRLIWSWFQDLHAVRDFNGAGPNPIRWSDIASYARLRRLPVEQRHLAVIRALDDCYLAHAYAARAAASGKRQGVKVIPKHSGQPLTASAFDAVFG